MWAECHFLDKEQLPGYVTWQGDVDAEDCRIAGGGGCGTGLRVVVSRIAGGGEQDCGW